MLSLCLTLSCTRSSYAETCFVVASTISLISSSENSIPICLIAFSSKSRRWAFFNNNGNLKLSVKLDNLYYIKAEDNYINVFYQRSGAIASYMLRCKMQTIADNCVDSSSLMRCHRSYIVNIKKVSVLHNEADGFVIDFEREGLDSVPVSKTYSAKVLEAFNKK